MKWATKALVQRIVAKLPAYISQELYFAIQRTTGSLRNLCPISGLQAGIDSTKRAAKYGFTPVGSSVFEIGTGRRINLPLSFWLMGSDTITTIDLNPYLRESLVKKDLLYIKSHRDFISNLYGGLIVQERLESLIHFMNKDWRLSDLLDFCCITYLAPSDAKTTTLISNSIDLVTSFTVLEHIPPSELKLIIAEMDRILKRTSGLHVHRIDYTDHFAHSDKSISPINFLRYSADEWNKIAGNQFMYMNRLRHHDYLSIFNENHHIVFDEPEVSSEVRTILPDFPLHEDFAFKSFSDLSTTAAWVTVLTN